VSTGVGTVPAARAGVVEAGASWARRNVWTLGLIGLLVAFLALTKMIQPNYGAPGIQGLAISILPIAFAAVAQAIVVISGGIDLSVGSMMALASVTSAVLMKDQGDLFGVAVVVGVLLLGLAVGAINGGLVVATKVPDIVVTLAMSFVWAGTALLILNTPGGGAAPWLMAIISGPLGNPWLPKALIVLGGVSLAGGRGGVLGPIIAVIVLALIRTDLTFLGVDPNLSTAIQGAILIGVVMFGSLVAMRKVRA
jgi:ribose/xylose/arabinose/galactoside ABC-type transport system permease subunit